MNAAEVVRHHEAEGGAPGRIGLRLGNHTRLFFPSRAGHAVADDGVPVERVRPAGFEAATADHDRMSDACERRGGHELAGGGE